MQGMTIPDLPPSVRRDEGRGGLACYTVQNALASAQIYEHGAHVAAFQTRDSQHPLLWLSEQSLFEEGKAIRGGVPLCFPWFGPRAEDSSAPMHGIARTGLWQLSAASEDDSGTRLLLVPSPELRDEPLWPRGCRASLEVLVGEALQITFSAQAQSQSCGFEVALHTYLSVADVRLAEVRGLEGAPFWDKVARTQQRGDAGPLRIAGETDRVYSSTSTCTVRDGSSRREITIEKQNSGSTIVWNPGEAKARAMPDFDDGGWRRMLCIETGNVGRHRVELGAGQSHQMTARLSARPAR